MERSVPAESSATTTPRRPLRWLVTILAIVVVGGLAATFLDGPQRASLPGSTPETPRPTDGTDRSEATRALVGELEEALRRGDASAARALAHPSRASRREITTLARNLGELAPTELSLRYLTEAATPTSARSAGDSTVHLAVDVQMTWALAETQPGTSTLEIPLSIAWDGATATFAAVREDADARVPLWLQDRVRVRRTEDTLLVTNRDDHRTLAAQVREAWRTVRRTLPDRDGALVVEAPRTSAEFETAAGMDAGATSAIAALTTTTDGSSRPDTPVQVYLNPPVFDPLGTEGRQIVLSHEATHVAVDALTQTVPYWLSEGLADHVALADTRLPVSVLAAQILALVAEDGPPRSLPGRVEFDGANEDIGAWYEAAWLATRLVADRYGDATLLEFYDTAVEDGERAAFREVLGVTKEEFVASWADHLAELAR